MFDPERNAIFELLRRTLSEREGDDRASSDPFSDQIRDPLGDHFRFAGPGGRNDLDVAPSMPDGCECVAV
jgi:hypothetical protein